MDRQVEGRRAVQEALRAGHSLDKLFFLATAEGLGQLLHSAKESGAVLAECDRKRLDAMSQTGSHQGVIGVFSAFRYAELDKSVAQRGEYPA